MLNSRQYLIKHVNEYVQPVQPELESPLLEAISFLNEGGQPPITVLNAVVEAASSNKVGVWSVGTTLLSELAENDSNVLAAIQQMFKSKKAQARHNAVTCLTAQMPIEFCLEMLRLGLLDKSVKVRGKAADWAGRLSLKALVPDLSKAEMAESDPETRKLISNELKLLRDGYLVEPAGDGTSFVTAKKLGGSVSRIVQNDIIASRGIDVIVAELSGS